MAKSMKSLLPLLTMVVALLPAAVRADDNKAAPADAAVEKKSEAGALSAEKIAELVKQLDANSFPKRQEASRKLSAAGKQVIPAVKEAAQGDSREVTTRSIDLLKKFREKGNAETKAAAKAALEELAKCDNPSAARRAKEALKPKPGPAQIAPGVPWMPGGRMPIQIQVRAVAGAKRVTVKNVNGVKDIDVVENGRKIKIHDDPNQGIKIEVTEKKDGKEKTSKYEAKNANELKKKHPEAYKIYKEYAEGQGGIRIQGIQIQGGGQIPIQIRPGGIRAMRLPMQGGAAKKAAEQIEKATKQLQEITEELKKLSGDDEKMQNALKRLEEVKQQLDEAKAKLTG